MAAVARLFGTIEELVGRFPDKLKYIQLSTEMPTAAAAAKVLGIEENAIAKTCILKANQRYVAVILQGSDRIDANKMKEHLGTKKYRFATPEEVLQKTGYIAGGTPPVGLGKGIEQIFIDQAVLTHKVVFGGGGLKEALLQLAPQTIVELSNAAIVNVREGTV